MSVKSINIDYKDGVSQTLSFITHRSHDEALGLALRQVMIHTGLKDTLESHIGPYDYMVGDLNNNNWQAWIRLNS